MPSFAYRGRAANGERMDGRVEAASLPEALASLERQGPAALEEVRAEGASRVRSLHLREGQVALLYQQLAAGIASGLPLPEALRVIASESPDRRVRAVMHHLWGSIQAGYMLSEAMEQFPDVFPALHRTVVRAGEEANALDLTLQQLAAHTEAVSRAARALALALAYPAAVAIFGLGIITFMVTFIVPKFLALFRDLGVKDLPITTGWLISLSRIWISLGLWFGAALVLIYLLFFYRTARRGGISADRIKLRVPVLGPFFFHLCHGRLAGTLAILVERGVPLPEAVRLAGSAAGNRVIEAGWRRAANLIDEGVPLAEALESGGGVPEVLSAGVAFGEEAGTLPQALRAAAEYYMQRAETAARQIGPVLEPVLVVATGLCVGAIATGIFMPLLSVVSALSGGDPN